MRILITGGTGYIGSHTCIELIKSRHQIVIIDNLSNSSRSCLARIEELVDQKIPFYKADIRNKESLRNIFDSHKIEAVIHFAALKSVGESSNNPLEYYDNNVGGTITLIEVMREYGCKNIVYSSSATVYGDPKSVPISEDCPINPTNPYGRTKIIIEDFLRDLFFSDNNWKIAILRYFNPIGAHKSGLIGEDPTDVPNNLLPFISQVAIRKLEVLKIFGNDFDTHDGTGIRDYIHVVDLAKGHSKALLALERINSILTINLGTGRGYSVLDVVEAFKKASGRDIPYKIVSRRLGDISSCFADPSYAYEVLDWKAESDIDEMCEDAWRWQHKNPKGYL